MPDRPAAFYRKRYQDRGWRDRNRTKLRRYGIREWEWWYIFFIEQGESCALCGITQEDLHIDHLHGVKAARGLLCQQCNWEVGVVENAAAFNPEKRKTILAYIFNFCAERAWPA